MKKRKQKKTIKINFLIIELLEKFSEKELTGLKRLVSCAYFNTDRYVVKLLDVLIRKILNKKILDSDSQVYIYRFVFSDMPAPKATLNKQEKRILHAKMSLLTRVAEQFLVIETLQTDSAYNTELLSPKLLEKKQFRLLHRHLKKNKKARSTQIEDIEHYTHEYKAETCQLSYLHHSGQLRKEDNLSDLNYSLNMYYLISKLDLYLTACSLQESFTEKHYTFSVMEDIAPLLQLPEYAGHPLIQNFRAAITLMLDKNDAAYRQLLDLLNQHAATLSRSNVHSFYGVAINFCIQQVKLGKLKYYRHLFELYRTMAGKGLLFAKEVISLVKLKNVVATSCRVGEFDWAIQVINYSHSFIPKKIQNDVINLNFGVVEFYKKNYRKTIDLLLPIGNISLNYDLDRRMMIVKSYYEIETEYKETTAQVFRSMEKYIKGNKLLTVKDKTAYKNFIRILINLYRIRHRATKMSLESIKDKLERQTVNSDKKWLSEKIKELEN